MQERPEDVPTGELPRSMQLIVDRHLVGKTAPGTRVTAYGIYSIYQAGTPCLRISILVDPIALF